MKKRIGCFFVLIMLMAGAFAGVGNSLKQLGSKALNAVNEQLESLNTIINDSDKSNTTARLKKRIDNLKRKNPDKLRKELIEKAVNWVKSFFHDDYPPYLYYGDYNKLVIGKNALTINGKPLGTFKLTKRGKQQYRKTNDFSDLSELLNILCDIQRAYYQDEKNYYYNSMISTVEEEINHYVFDCTFRPSPRIIIDTLPDSQMRYNKNY